MNAPIIKILDHTLVDGPGNRTAIFFQGCNLSCRYCHNPETQRLCRHCGRCLGSCPTGALSQPGGSVIWDQQLCLGCDSCLRACPEFSSPKVMAMTADEVFAAVSANVPFIRGITVSGGECALYLPFLTDLFQNCRQIGLTCLIDSNGTIPLWDDPVMDACDGVMLDVKAWDDNLFYELTGGHNEMVKRNLRELARMEKLTELRVVCFEDDSLVDAGAVIDGISRNVTENVKAQTMLKLIRFRNHGVAGPLSRTASPSAARMEGLRQTAADCGFKKIRVV